MDYSVGRKIPRVTFRGCKYKIGRIPISFAIARTDDLLDLLGWEFKMKFEEITLLELEFIME